MVDSGSHDERSAHVNQTGVILHALSRLKNRARALFGFVVLPWLGCGGSVEQGGGTSLATDGGSNGVGGAGAHVGGSMATGGLGYAGSAGAVNGCSATLCEDPMCPPNSRAVTFSGQCCPRCQVIDASCAQVVCLSLNCPSGFAPRRDPGACCDTCITMPGANYPNCGGVCDPLPTTSCPLGHHKTYPDWSCCGACEPDPNYCEADSDCIIATEDTGCCSCPISISKRLYADDPCYSSLDAPRPVPAYCLPQNVCTVSCGACTTGAIPYCQNHTCSSVVGLN